MDMKVLCEQLARNTYTHKDTHVSFRRTVIQFTRAPHTSVSNEQSSYLDEHVTDVVCHIVQTSLPDVLQQL